MKHLILLTLLLIASCGSNNTIDNDQCKSFFSSWTDVPYGTSTFDFTNLTGEITEDSIVVHTAYETECTYHAVFMGDSNSTSYVTLEFQGSELDLEICTLHGTILTITNNCDTLNIAYDVIVMDFE